jgi:hypothetical protein
VAGRGAAEARESGGGEGEWLVLGLPAEWIRESVDRGNNRGERRDCGQARVLGQKCQFWGQNRESKQGLQKIPLVNAMFPLEMHEWSS